jgi:hypothetical protein
LLAKEAISMIEIDGREYLNTSEAAKRMDVHPSTISTWRKRGYLTPHPASPQGHPFYDWHDVALAEKAAYDAAIRTSGSAKRSSRRDLPPRAAHAA